MNRRLLLPAACLAVLTGCASSFSSSGSAPGPGHPTATVMLTVHLRSGTEQSAGPRIAQDAITQTGVLWSNFIPGTGVVVGADTAQHARTTENHLRTSWPEINTIDVGSAPAVMPAPSKS